MKVLSIAISGLAIVSALMCSAADIRAQEGRGRGGVVFPPEGGPFRFRVQPDVVKGAPYSADVITESTQTLSDGNRIVLRTSARVYRDNEGRTRREESRPSGPPLIMITDPAAGTAITVDVERRIARQGPVLLDRFYALAATERARLDALSSQVKGLAVLLNGAPATAAVRVGPGDGGGIEEPNVEQLPGRTVAGVLAEGTRRTTTIAAGAIGNERPITVVSEEWTSPDLKVLVASENSDPRVGKTSYRLENIVRGDPDPSLFQVPPDYTLQPAEGGRGARGAAPR
jgi:hypothetical protein